MLDSPSIAAALTALLGDLAEQRLAVAYSGGCDSSVLLSALAELRGAHGFHLRALHFNHQLQDAAAAWQQHCQAVCDTLGVPLLSARAGAAMAAARGPEAAARAARYAWFESVIEPNEVLLTAHHADDQVETVLLNLMRAGGLAQLGGIPALRALSAAKAARVARPLLKFTQAELRHYAARHSLRYVDDASNHDRRFERNYLRHEIMPALQRRWPSLHRAVAQSAAQVQQAADLLQRQALDRLRDYQRPAKRRIFCLAAPISLQALLAEADFGVTMVLREWLHAAGYASPARRQLLEFQRQLRHNPQGGAAVLECTAVALCQYRRHLYLIDPCPLAAREELEWPFGQPVRLGPRLLMTLTDVPQLGLRRAALRDARVTLSWRQAGARVQLPRRTHRSALKKLFQQHAIPPWERRQLPLVRVDDEIAWVAGVGVTQAFAQVGEGACLPQLQCDAF